MAEGRVTQRRQEEAEEKIQYRRLLSCALSGLPASRPRYRRACDGDPCILYPRGHGRGRGDGSHLAPCGAFRSRVFSLCRVLGHSLYPCETARENDPCHGGLGFDFSSAFHPAHLDDDVRACLYPSPCHATWNDENDGFYESRLNGCVTCDINSR